MEWLECRRRSQCKYISKSREFLGIFYFWKSYYVLLAHEIRTHRILDRSSSKRWEFELVLSSQLSRSQLHARLYADLRSGIFLPLVVCDSRYRGSRRGRIDCTPWWDAVHHMRQVLWPQVNSWEADMDMCGCRIRLKVLRYPLDHGYQIYSRARLHKATPEGKSALDHASDGSGGWYYYMNYRE